MNTSCPASAPPNPSLNRTRQGGGPLSSNLGLTRQHMPLPSDLVRQIDEENLRSDGKIVAF